MSDIKRRATEARTLLSDPALTAVLEEIRADAVAAFLTSGGNAEQMTKAHQDVQAVETILNALQRRITAQDFEDKKRDQHRASD
jgi:hypothetical protein